MVSSTDVDDSLEGEIKEEMKKYGQIKSVNVHVVSYKKKNNLRVFGVITFLIFLYFLIRYLRNSILF